jgi:hypothetical protein
MGEIVYRWASFHHLESALHCYLINNVCMITDRMFGLLATAEIQPQVFSNVRSNYSRKFLGEIGAFPGQSCVLDRHSPLYSHDPNIRNDEFHSASSTLLQSGGSELSGGIGTEVIGNSKENNAFEFRSAYPSYLTTTQSIGYACDFVCRPGANVSTL